MSGEITCPNCRQSNLAGNSFCARCGGSLTSVQGPGSESPTGAVEEEERRAFQGELASVRSQLREAGLLLDRLQDRIAQLELGQEAPTTLAPDSPPPTATPGYPPEAPVPDQPRVAESTRPPNETPSSLRPASVGAYAGASPGALGGSPPSPPPGAGRASGGDAGFRKVSIDWEQVLGRNWFAIIGAVALVLGIGFFLKLAFDNNWIGNTGRIALGIGLGIALLGVGEYAQRRIPVWAQPVTASGAAILYLSIYASFGLYQLLRPDAAFLFMALVVALAGLLALRYESMVIALLGVVGAFLAPVLLGPDLPDIRLLLVYIVLVDLGILGVSTFRNWRWFILLGWAGSYAVLTYGLAAFPDYGPVLIQIALTAIFLIFAGATTLFHLLWRRIPTPLDMGLVAINATAYFALTVGILGEDRVVWLGPIALGLALFYGLTAYAAVKRPGAPPEIALIALPVALVFLTIAVPLQLSGVWVTVAWAAQGGVLVWSGFTLGRWPTRAFGLGAVALSVAHLALFDVGVNLDDFRPVINERFPVFLAVIAAFYAAGFLYWRNRAVLMRQEQYAAPTLFGIANLLTLALLSLEIVNYFDSRGQGMEDPSFEQLQSLNNATELSLTVMFTMYAFILMAVGLGRRLLLVRWAGLVLMGLAVLKLLGDTERVILDPLTFTAFLNIQFLTFFLVLAALLGTAYWFRRESPRMPETEAYAWQVLLAAANLVGVWALSQEILHYFGSLEVRVGEDYLSAKHLSLTVLWAVYSIGVIGAGIVLRSTKVRLTGMALLAIPVAKLFVFDVFLLERGYRVAAFVTLGVLLLGTGLVYQRYSQAIRGFLFDRRT